MDLGRPSEEWSALLKLSPRTVGILAQELYMSYGGKLRKLDNRLYADDYREAHAAGLLDAQDRISQDFRGLFMPPGRWKSATIAVPAELSYLRRTAPGEWDTYAEYNGYGERDENNFILSSAETGSEYYTNSHIMERGPLATLDEEDLRIAFKRSSEPARNPDKLLAVARRVIGKRERALRVGPDVIFLSKTYGRMSEYSNTERRYMAYSEKPRTLLLNAEGEPAVVDSNYLRYFQLKHGEEMEIYTEGRNRPLVLAKGRKFLGVIMPMKIEPKQHPTEQIMEAVRRAYPAAVL